MMSFRTRLFVVAALIVAAVLATVGGLGWSRLLDAQLGDLDDRLCNEAHRVATQPDAGRDIARLQEDLALKLRVGSTDQVLVRFDPEDGAPAFQSTGWSDAPQLEGLGWVASAHGVGRRPPPPRPPPLSRRPPPERARDGDERPPCELASFANKGGQWRAARFVVPFGRSVVAADVGGTRSALQGAVGQVLGVVVPLALLLTAVGAWLLSGLMMRPVNRLRLAMKDVNQRALDQRLPSAGEDREFKELIGEYNQMLARLEASFGQASRFSADAAHELKTPLTILQGRIEQAIHRSDHRAIQVDLTEMLDEVGRLAQITRKLLLLSQADAGRLALQLTRVDVSELLGDMMNDAHMLIGGKTLDVRIAPGLATQADAVLLRQLLNNLVANAVRYCRPAGRVWVRGRTVAAGIEIVFANETAPISAADRDRFFERFFRGDAAHGRGTEGNGLGLSLAREIARAHGGDVVLDRSPIDEVRMRLTLPRR